MEKQPIRLNRRELLQKSAESAKLTGALLMAGGSWDLLRRMGIKVGASIVTEKDVADFKADQEKWGTGWDRVTARGEVEEANLDIKVALAGSTLLLSGVIFSREKSSENNSMA